MFNGQIQRYYYDLNKINYEYKSNTISMVKEPNDYIKDSDHPLYCDKNEGKEHVTISDIKELMKLKNGK